MLNQDPETGVAVLVLDFPPANAIGPGQIDLLDAALSAAAQARCRALVVLAKGRFFCAGADIRIMQGDDAAAQRAGRLAAFAARLQELFARIETFPAPTIAAIDGIATGGGLELALACDFRIAAEAAQLGLPETKLGLIPAAGGTQRMVAVVGRAHALDLILRGRLIAGPEAWRIGLVHEVAFGNADARPAEKRALALATELAAQPQAALREAKRCIAMTGSPAGFEAEIVATRILHTETETMQRIAAFLARSARAGT
ncbi:MAG: enoyl-CoA hydratase/isomerase family protein [Burkholderiales bacterium]|nr:enoyl-CoA hydratase/isomerase family protein [Burkholderiales bacterium]